MKSLKSLLSNILYLLLFLLTVSREFQATYSEFNTLGHPCDLTKYPFLVTVISDHAGFPHCLGVIVAPKWVLSIRDCGDFTSRSGEISSSYNDSETKITIIDDLRIKTVTDPVQEAQIRGIIKSVEDALVMYEVYELKLHSEAVQSAKLEKMASIKDCDEAIVVSVETSKYKHYEEYLKTGRHPTTCTDVSEIYDCNIGEEVFPRPPDGAGAVASRKTFCAKTKDGNVVRHEKGRGSPLVCNGSVIAILAYEDYSYTSYFLKIEDNLDFIEYVLAPYKTKKMEHNINQTKPTNKTNTKTKTPSAKSHDGRKNWNYWNLIFGFIFVLLCFE